MTIYVVKNERNEEVSSYTNIQSAKRLAEQLQYLFLQHYWVEQLICESDKESKPS